MCRASDIREGGGRITLVGVDENGYGPALGPLVVTAAAAEAPGRPGGDRLNLWKVLGLADRPGKNPFVCDSKLAFGPGKERFTPLAEETALAFFYLARGSLPETGARFLSGVTANNELGLASPCGRENRFSCCREEDLPLLLDAGRRDRIRALAGRIAERARREGVVFKQPRALLFCPGLLNRLTGPGRVAWNGTDLRNKSDLTAQAGLKLARTYIRETQAFHLLAGKVGGLRYYGDRIREAWPGYAVQALAEEPGRSAYRLIAPSNVAGEVCYLEDGERASFLAALASMLGKYLRELSWAMMAGYFHRRRPDLPRASGYRNQRTRDFIRLTKPLRKREGIPDDCFFRR